MMSFIHNHPLLWLLITFVVGYVLAWLVTGNLIKRIKNTRHYLKHHSLKQAWYYAGRTL